MVWSSVRKWVPSLVAVVVALAVSAEARAYYLGIRMRNTSQGVQVVEVLSNSPAEAAKFLQNDVFISVNGQPVSTTQEVSDAIDASVGGQLQAVVRGNDGVEAKITADLGEETVTKSVGGVKKNVKTAFVKKATRTPLKKATRTPSRSRP